MKTKLVRILAWSSGAGRVISKLVTFANVLLTVFSLDETIANTFTYFLVPFYMYCYGQLNHCLKISGNKNNLRTT